MTERNIITEKTCNAIDHALEVTDYNSMTYRRRYNKARRIYQETAQLAPRYAEIDFDSFMDQYMFNK